MARSLFLIVGLTALGVHDGTLRERVAAPPGPTVIGHGPAAVYGVQRDGALLYLRRWTK